VNHCFKVLFIASELNPLAKAGGLGDVVGSLPRALRQAGHDVRITLPRYSSINLESYQTARQSNFTISFMGRQEEIGIIEVLLKDVVPVYLLENQSYFDRSAIYGENDDLERFLLFSMAAMEVPKKLNWQPDILHCHDWHAGMVAPLLKIAHRNDAFYSSCASVFTIHNLAYQGWFDNVFAERASLYGYMPPLEDPYHDKCYSMTGLGIYHSDFVSTVSETYAREILTPEYGEGLETLLQKRQDSLIGILNGIDYEQFNPATDCIIATNYDVGTLDRRIVNKTVLQEKAGLPVDAGIPLLGFAGRLVDQKGIDILIGDTGALQLLLDETNIQFVLQGVGDAKYEESFRKLESIYPSKVRAFITLDFSLAQLIFAGSDIFLVPSRFEPCGLTPLVAMRYGSIPIVRHTGGLSETVAGCPPDLSDCLGFVFERYDANELLATLKLALTALKNKNEWHKLMVRAMQADFSWKASIPKYEAIYKMAQRKVLR
jgi:starch synthase